MRARRSTRRTDLGMGLQQRRRALQAPRSLARQSSTARFSLVTLRRTPGGPPRLQKTLAGLSAVGVGSMGSPTAALVMVFVLALGLVFSEPTVGEFERSDKKRDGILA